MKQLKRSIPLLVVACLFLASAHGFAQDISVLEFPKLGKLKVPEVKKVTLDNGMRLYVLEDHSLPIFGASARINCGSYLESAAKVGLAEMCGAVMRTGGTQKWTGDQIDEMLEGIGGSVETSIGTVSGSARVRMLSDYTDLGLEVLAQVLQHPVFEQDKVDLSKIQERSSIARRNDDPFPILLRVFRNAIYGKESPYARHTEYATIDAITRDDLVQFHDNYIRPENVQLAVWGDFDKDDIIAKIKMYFGGWQRGTMEVPTPPDVDYKFENKVYQVEKEKLPQAYILMGHVGGYLTDADYPARIVMNSILGGFFGSRLVDNVRSKEGLAYTTQGAYTAQIGRPGIFYLFASTKPGTMSQATLEMIKQARSMQTDPPTDVEMQKGKDGYLNSFVFKFDSKPQVLSRLMEYDFYGLPEDLIFKIKDGVENVTKDDVIEAARKNLHPDEMRIVILGDTASFDEPPAQMDVGPVEDVDITIPSGETKKELAVTPENIAKGKAILDQAVAAAGGLDNFKKINSVTVNGTFLLSMQGQQIPLKIESIEVFPDKGRTVMNVMGREMLDIQNGDAGWQTDPMSGQIKEKTPEEIDQSEREERRDLIRIFRQADAPDYRAVFDGDGDIDGKPVEYVVLIDDDGQKICRFAFDKDTHLAASKSYWGQAPGMGEGTIEEFYDSYQTVGGVMVSMHRVQNFNGKQFGEMSISEYSFNSDIPADAFSKPE